MDNLIPHVIFLQECRAYMYVSAWCWRNETSDTFYTAEEIRENVISRQEAAAQRHQEIAHAMGHHA